MCFSILLKFDSIYFILGNSSKVWNGGVSAEVFDEKQGAEISFKLPNWIPRAIGILLRFKNSNCKGDKNSTNNIKSLVISNSLVIEATSTNFGVDLESQDKINKQKYEITRNFYDHRPAI